MKNKKTFYYFLGALAGLLLSFIAHGIIEMFYVNSILSDGLVLKSATSTYHCFLPLFLQITLPVTGIALGLLISHFYLRNAKE